jgi:hypothetical protein
VHLDGSDKNKTVENLKYQCIYNSLPHETVTPDNLHTAIRYILESRTQRKTNNKRLVHTHTVKIYLSKAQFRRNTPQRKEVTAL